MHINIYIDKLLSFCFPLKAESAYFIQWDVSTYRAKLTPSASLGTRTYSLFSYKDKNVRKLIHSLKKEKVLSIRDAIASLMAEEIIGIFADEYIFETTPIYLVPIPLSKKRLRERGFNQSAWIASKVAEIAGEGFAYKPQLLSKIKETKKQSRLHRNERLSNPLGSFRASGVPKGARIIIIDDVFTTGATTLEARKMLMQAGARSVDVFCVAH